MQEYSSPFISVIVPMYKVERYIKFCIDSILNQTFQDFEIIIIDDASPDNCYEICQKLYGNNEKVRILKHAYNKGLSEARNTGIENARGKYVYFVDSDDLIVPNALEILYNAAIKTDAEVIHTCTWYTTFQDDDKPINVNQLALNKSSYDTEDFIKNDIPHRLLEFWCTYRIASMAWLDMCSLEFLRKNNLTFLDIVSEDEIFSFDTLCTAQKYYILNKAIYVYRRREKSIMTKYDADRFSKGVKSVLLALNYLKNKMDTTPSLAYNQKIQDIIFRVYFERQDGNHVRPFYDGKNINPVADKIVFNEFLPIFKENTFLVKYLFNQTNNLYQDVKKLSEQVKLLTRQNQQFQSLNVISNAKNHMLNVIDELKNTDKRFLFMLSPTHGNIGDQAIVLGEYFVMKSCFPEYKIIDIPYDYFVGELGKIFSGLGYQKYIRQTDNIVLHGGGNLGNLWVNEEVARRAVIENFPNNRIVIFPQSIHFTDDDAGKNESAISSKIYNAHKDLHLMLRDENSFAVAEKLFPNVQKYLLPDIVTALFGQFDKFNAQRDGVLFILRKDKEKVRDDSFIAQIQTVLKNNNIPFSVSDTVINETVTTQNRLQKVSDTIMQFRKSKLVVTDRFHGVVFSAITRTPVVAFKSYDTKISSGIKWFKDFPSVYYAENSNLTDTIGFMEKAYNDVYSSPPPVWEWLRNGFVKKFFKINS